MSTRTYFYCRVSTIEQTIENQVSAFERYGYDVNSDLVVSETISGSTIAMSRPEFRNMVDNKLIKGDTLVVLKLDRLGRDNIDVQKTIQLLLDKGVKVICLDLPVKDLSTSEGKLMLQMFSAFAEFERNRIRERTREGLERAKSEGKKLGRRQQTDINKVAELRNSGHTIAETAQMMRVSEATVKLCTRKAKELGLITVDTSTIRNEKKVQFKVSDIAKLRNNGLSIGKIQKELGCSKSTVTNGMKKAKELGLIQS